MKKVFVTHRLVVRVIVMLFSFHFSLASVNAQTAMGHWRDCFDYSTLFHVEVADDVIYGAAKGGLVKFDVSDRTLQTLSRVTGLSDVDIATIAYDKQSGCLVVAYKNSNIDILDRGRVYNISDIKRTELSANKEIAAVRFHKGKAYVATGFGVVVVDLARHEISETWFLGIGGSHTTIRDIAFSDDSIFAATGEGLKRVALTEAHPSISDRWTSFGSPDGSMVTMLAHYDGSLLAVGYSYDPLNLTLYKGSDSVISGEIRSLHVGGGRVALSIDGHIVSYGSGMTEMGSYDAFTWGNLDAFDAAFSENGTLWVAHSWAGLVGVAPDGSDEMHQPEGPASGDNSYRLRPFRNRMMLCPGGHTSIYSNTYLDPNVLTASGNGWYGLDRSSGILQNKSDVVDVAVNPRDTSEAIAALWGYGLAVIRDNKVVDFYDETNTLGVLHPYTFGSFYTLRTASVNFDRRGNLWVLLSNTDHAIACRSVDGQWTSFSTAAISSNLEVDKMLVDSIRGYIWFAGRDNYIYVHDGESRVVRVNPNIGSKMQTDAVNAIAQDQSGNIWVGTNKGIKVIYDGYNAFRNGGTGEIAPVTCSNITISNGDFSEYLMAYESITSIVVDGANRKWVGTATGGLYLLSANGMEQLLHFTVANSPLLSDKIVCLGIQPRSGEIFVGTDKGLQAYRGTATDANSEPQPEVYAYPNPVRPGYDGPIAIKGFTRNALVHITDAAGNAVFSTQAYGGQAIWNGRTSSGELVASGIYYVFASDVEGGNRSVAKVLIIR